MTSELKILVGNRAGKSYVKQAYCTQPFKVAPVGEDKSDLTLYLMVRSSSPGILDGDHYEMQIDLAENTRLHLQTQSYQRLFRMQKGASQSLIVNLGNNSSFCYLPHPLVPHENSIFRSYTTINLAAGATLTLGEVITCGRKLSGEVFKFSYLQLVTQVYRQGRLILKDHLLLQPEVINLGGLGQFENFTHQATLIYLNEKADTKFLADLVHERLAEVTGIAAGVTQTAHNGLLIRLLGSGAEQLYHCLHQINNVLQAAQVIPEVSLVP